MALVTAYVKLQLNADDHIRVANFKALCWKHILAHVTPSCVDRVQNGEIRLQRQSITNPYGRSYDIFHVKLDEISYAFVKLYADRIWPQHDKDRTHLAEVVRLQGTYTTELRATD